MVKNEVVYGCGCKAAGDNAAVYCSKHGNPERGRTSLEARCEFLNRENEALRTDMMDAVESLGVRPMCYNGLHRAWLNQTNADVKTFKTAEECRKWCDEINRRFGTEGLEQTGNHISAQLERHQAVVRVLRSMDRRGLLGKELRDALAAVDATPEGEGTNGGNNAKA